MDSPELQLLKTIAINQQRTLTVFGAQLTELTALVNAVVHLQKGQLSKMTGASLLDVDRAVAEVLRTNREAAEQSSLDLHQKFELSAADDKAH